ncbi:MAG: 2,3-bisphosphoglycerate-independent phosphoglycerate mutase [bacterium ADurb.Bin212]|nr:MAG: 2,3-bisphosphoglycerate-independent phosphoglycerate mutase [bacterium ADurb.Bin212]
MLIQKVRSQKIHMSSFNKDHSPYVLLVLDGWGIAPSWGGNAISQAKTPNYNYLCKNFLYTTVKASGRDVGLPDDSAGNSEAGHLNLGAGKIILQDETIINKEIENGHFFQKKLLLEAFDHAQKNNSTVHFMGLLSDAGTHSHISHLFALIDMAKQLSFRRVKLHLFSDGRDSAPMSGIELLDKVERYISHAGIGEICSIMGRYYAMDRDNRWGRTSRAYNTLVKGEAEFASNARQVFSKSYARGITDEFIEPRIIVNAEQHASLVKDNDVVILFNFRPDRVKQITMSFLANEIAEFPDRKKLNNIKFLSFTMYEQHYGDWPIQHIFKPDTNKSPLSKILSENNLKQLHIAETEKYAHVTYFFNGGNDKPFPNENWNLVPSPKVKTYDVTPHMSAQTITTYLVKALDENKYDVIVANYANPDMVGHTGNLQSTIQAVTFVDHCLGVIAKKVVDKGGTLLVCADHGNAEQMISPTTGQAYTEHSTNPVPFIIASKHVDKVKNHLIPGRLSDIAPTLLYMANIGIPDEMAGSNILFR